MDKSAQLDFWAAGSANPVPQLSVIPARLTRGIVTLLLRKDFDHNFASPSKSHTNVDDPSILYTENAKYFLVYSPSTNAYRNEV